MFFDLLNDAVNRAKTELEKTVDSALGLQGESHADVPPAPSSRAEPAAGKETPGAPSTAIAPSSEDVNGKPPVHGSSAAAGPAGSPAPGTKTVKKVIKKVIKKVPKQPAADGTPGNTLKPVSSAASLAADAAASSPASKTQDTTLQQPDSTALQPASNQVTEAVSTRAEPSQADEPAGTPPFHAQPTQPQAHTAHTHDDHGTQQQQQQQDTDALAALPDSRVDSQHTAPTTDTHKANGWDDGWGDADDIVLPSAETSTPVQHAADTQPIAPPAATDTPSAADVAGSTHPSHDGGVLHPAASSIEPAPQLSADSTRGATETPQSHLEDAIPQPQSELLPPQPAGDRHSKGPSRRQSHDSHTVHSTDPPGFPADGAIHEGDPDPGAQLVAPGSGFEHLSQTELVGLVQQLRDAVAVRDARIAQQADEAERLEQVVAQLQEKNEALALKTASISEQDYEEMRKECEQRVAVAERKVYALTKERDALKRGNEKLSDYGALIKEKDGIIKQVMEEGERLAARQAELESTVKKLRGQIKDLEMEKDLVSNKLANEETTSEALKKAKAKLERDLQEAQEQAAHDLEQAKLQADSLLLKARTDQAEAEERAREAANAGLARKLRESESRAEALSETVIELREALDRQRQAADLREEMLKQDIADLERRCQSAEVRHQELAAKLPDATRPLLRQIEAMQSAADAQASAWAAAEQTLAGRIEDAEGRAAAAAERERHATERCQGLQARAAGLEAALSAARAELKSRAEELDQLGQSQASLTEQLQTWQERAQLEAEHCKLVRQQLTQAEEKHAQALLLEQQARVVAEGDAATVRREYERRLSELEAQLAEARAASGGLGGLLGPGDHPPSMAAPGYKWVLQKEGDPGPPAESSRLSSSPQQAPAPVSDSAPAPSGRGMVHSSSHAGLGSTPDLLASLVPNGGNSSGLPLASDLESMRAALRIRSGEVASLEAQVRALEATRDRLSEELVAAAQKSEEAAAAIATVESLQQEITELKNRYVAAVELLGERDEALEELRADLMDVKNLYREQIDFMVLQLAQTHGSESQQAH